MPINLDFGPDAVAGALPPEDEYEVQCTKCEFVEAKSADKFPYLRWEFIISDGPHAAKTFPISHITSLSPNSRYFLQQFLEALTQSSWNDDNMELDPQDMPGHIAKAIIIHQPYTSTKDGTEKMGLKISALLPATESKDYKTFG